MTPRASFTIAVLMFSAPAFGKDPDALAKLVKEGDHLYQAAKYKEAAETLKQAYAIEPNPKLLYNIARAYDQAGELRSAVDYYQRYVGSTEGTEATLLRRAALSLERLRGLVEKEDRQEAEHKKMEQEALVARQKAEAQAEAAAKAQQAEAQRRKAVVEAYAATRRSYRTGAYVVGGIGVAAVGAGVVFGVLANSSQSNFKQAAALADKDAFAAQTRQNALFADIGYGVGLAAIVTAVVLYPKGSEADAPVAFWLGPASVGLKGSF